MPFVEGSVPAKGAAKVYGKDPTWVRAGIVEGWLPTGRAICAGTKIEDVNDISSKKGRISYYISPKLLYEDTGYIWKGEQQREK